MSEFKYEVMGVQFNKLEKLASHFDKIIDMEETVFATKKTFEHVEEGLNFKYKYIIDCVACEGKMFYSLEMIILPESCCEEYLIGCLSSSGFDDVDDVDELSLIDTFFYGGNTITFGTESEDTPAEDNDWNYDLLDKIASVYETFDSLRGFYIDKPWNAIGTTGWDTIKHCVNGDKLFKF